MSAAARDGDKTRLHALLTEIFETCDALTEAARLALRARHLDEAVMFDAAWAIASEHVENFETERPSLARPLISGEVLGDFEVVAWLGGGGSATVYRARSTLRPERQVALKVIEFSRDEPARHRAKFAKEVRTLEAVRHRNVATIFDHGVTGERGYYAMELVDGPTLAGILAELVDAPELLDSDRVRRLVGHVGDIARALHEVHRTGHVHCDVKPANVVVERSSGDVDVVPRGRAVLIDFGLARDLDGQKTTVHVSMTPRFAPREQIRGQRLDVRCDVYGLGVTLHDLLAGPPSGTRTPPYRGLVDIRRTAPGIDRDLASIISMATHPDRRCRHASAAALADDLEAWSLGRPSIANRLPAWRRVVSWHLHDPFRTVRTAVRLLVIALVVFVSHHVVDQWRLAREASAAYARGDIASLVGVVRSLDSPTVSLLPESMLSNATLEAIASGDEIGPIGIAAALDRRDPYRAWVLAATPMVSSGPRADPIGARFFVSELERVTEHRERMPSGDDTADIIRLAARVVHERPALTHAAVASLDGLRRFALAQLDPASRPGVLRLHAYTILSGSATPTDVPFLLDRARGRSVLDEERRLAMAAAERTIRRSRFIGDASNLDFERLSASAIDLVGAYHGEALELTRESARARDFDVYRRLVLASLLAARAAGRHDLFDASWRRRASCDAVTREFADLGVELDAAAGGVDLQAVIRTPGSLTVDAWGRIGRLIGLAHDEESLATARGVLATTPVDQQGIVAFEHEHRLADLERDGRIDGLEADADTLLGAEFPNAGEWADLRGSGGATSVEDSSRIAAWDFRSSDLSSEGAAGPVSLRAATIERADGEAHYLRLYRFGDSALRLRFRTTGLAGRFDRLVLRLVLQTAARDYFPHHGVSFVDLFLDGDRLGREQLIDVSHVHQRPIVLAPAHRMADGDHEVEVRLSNRSTTQLWILTAIVEVVE